MQLEDFKKHVELFGGVVVIKANPLPTRSYKRMATFMAPPDLNPTPILNLITEILDGDGLWDGKEKILL